MSDVRKLIFVGFFIKGSVFLFIAHPMPYEYNEKFFLKLAVFVFLFGKKIRNFKVPHRYFLKIFRTL